MTHVLVGAAKNSRSAAASDLMKPAAFLFDLDGTLIDTEMLWTKSLLDFMASRGVLLTLEELLKHVIGRNSLDINSYLHTTYPQIGNTTPEQDAKELRVFFEKHLSKAPDTVIHDSVRFFKEAATVAPCAIVSGSPHDDIVASITKCGLLDITAFVLGSGEYEHGKPSPAGYLKAAQILGVQPTECVVVEDSTVGVASGVAAGMNVIGLDRGAEGPKQSYDGCRWKVSTLAELSAKEIEL